MNIDAHFALSSGAKVNNHKCSVTIAYTKLGGRDNTLIGRVCSFFVCPHWRTDASTRILVNNPSFGYSSDQSLNPSLA